MQSDLNLSVKANFKVVLFMYMYLLLVTDFYFAILVVEGRAFGGLKFHNIFLFTPPSATIGLRFSANKDAKSLHRISEQRSYYDLCLNAGRPQKIS